MQVDAAAGGSRAAHVREMPLADGDSLPALRGGAVGRAARSIDRYRKVDAAAREGWSSGLWKRLANARFRTYYAQKKAARVEGGLREWEGQKVRISMTLVMLVSSGYVSG